VRSARKLSKLERALAICLSLIWIAVGCVALDAALVQSHWLIAACAVAAIAYGIAWARVAVLSRLLTWPRLIAPWRSDRS
jgi:hypothetical protein